MMLTGLATALRDERPFWDQVGLYMIRATAKRFQIGGEPKWPTSRRASSEGGRTMLLSNRLRNSIAYEADAQGCIVGTNVAYAKLVGEGGIVKPRRAKALAIPVNKKARMAAEQLTESQSIRDIPGLTYIPRKGKPPLLVKEIQKGRGSARGTVAMEVWFVLMQSVKIPARPFLLVNSRDMQALEKLYDRHVREAAEGQKGGARVH